MPTKCGYTGTTKPEINVQYFIVQRRLSNEAGFKNIDTVSSQALNGFSLSLLNYNLYDPNSYRAISYYRLQMVNYNSAFSYSNIVAVGGTSWPLINLLWPNPTTDLFYLGLNPGSKH